jgi:D-alanyl-D-alanine carboxypeptidase
MLDRIVTLRRPAQGFARAFAVAAMVSGASLFVAGNAAASAPNAAIVVDAKSGKVLYSSHADAKRYPASLTKMMTLYLLFESIDSGRNGLNSSIEMSAHCAAQAPSKLGLKPGQTIKARDAILALVTKSANDVACAVGEHLAGSEPAFAREMTKQAHALGMSNTTFRNASGLPDDTQMTTARDMATLGRALQDHFPDHYKYFATRSFKWGKNTYANHNHLLGRVDGVDGIKTGYTRASGFNLVSSVKRNNREIVAVVLGGDTGKARDQRMASLIDAYLPKATKGRRTAAIVPGAPETVADNAPIPPKRPDANDPVVTASVVGANSIFALAAIEQGDASASEDVETPATRAIEETFSEPSPVIASGWKIQLAATPTQSSALEILNRAREIAPRTLANASPYTETVVKEDVTLHRARFAGFAGRDEARAACAELSKHDFACLALSN